MDADLIYSPKEIKSISKALNYYTMVVGNRYRQRVLDEHRIGVTGLSPITINKIADVNLHNPMCGFRVYSLETAKMFCDKLRSKGYGVETEQLILCKINGLNIGQYDLKYVVPQEMSTKAIEFIYVISIILGYSNELYLKPHMLMN